MSLEKAFIHFNEFAGQCIHSFISIIKVLMRFQFSRKLPKTTNNTCVVLGNGPSLKTFLKNHSIYLKDKPLMCVNSFSTSKEYAILKPEFYVILDQTWWLSDAEIIINTLEAIKNKTDWPLQLLIPKKALKNEKFTILKAENKNVKLVPVNLPVFKGFTWLSHFFYSKNWAMPQSQNVVVASLFFAINMGFKKIIVLGADHNWHESIHVDEKNILNEKLNHFHDDLEKNSYQPIRKVLHLKETYKVHELFAAWSKVFFGYLVLEKYSKYMGCKIYNASEVSFIDAFERLKIGNNK